MEAFRMSHGPLKIVTAQGYEYVFFEATQSLTVAITGRMRRTLSGSLVWTGHPRLVKFESSIEITGKEGYAFVIPLEEEIDLHCIERLADTSESDEIFPRRKAVPGSLYGEPQGITFVEESSGLLKRTTASAKGLWKVSYAPVLRMRVQATECFSDGWGERKKTTVRLVEV